MKQKVASMSKQKKTNWYLVDGVHEVKGRRNAEEYKQVKGKGVISGPFPTRDIARLYAGKRLSRNCVLALFHGDMLKHRLQFLGCSHEVAFSVALHVDKRMTEYESESWRNLCHAATQNRTSMLEV